jgi:hypothetical protein
MATNMSLGINYVNSDVSYSTTPANFILLDLTNDYLCWTAGDTTVKDLMTYTPNATELNAAATIISETVPVTVALCLLVDYSHNVLGSYYTHAVHGMGANHRYSFMFSFDGSTSTEPQLEAWDDSDHDSTLKYVLGGDDVTPLETPANSMVKAVCTTDGLPGASWVGTAIAGDEAARVLKLNNGNGALPELESGETSQELYANLKVQIPAAFSHPSVESFVLCIRYCWS